MEMCCQCGGGEPKTDDDGRTPTESDAVLDRFDSSMNGKLELAEFEEFWPIFCEICPFANAEEMFNLYDRDNDGCLSREEFEELYARDDVEEKDNDDDDGVLPPDDDDDDDDKTIPDDEFPECDGDK